MFSRLSAVRALALLQQQQYRQFFWTKDPFSDLKFMVREMEKQYRQVERTWAESRLTNKIPEILG
jgi:hypothetical protein